MKESAGIRKLHKFNESIFQQVEDYISEMELFSEEAVLVVDEKSLELKYGEPQEFTAAKNTFTMKQLIHVSDAEIPEPDADSIFELASGFVFVR